MHTQAYSKVYFFPVLRNKETASPSPPAKSHLQGLGGKSGDLGGGLVRGEMWEFFLLLFSTITPHFQCFLPKTLGVHTACHPREQGQGSSAEGRRLMPAFNKSWVQCESWVDGGGGEAGTPHPK